MKISTKLMIIVVGVTAIVVPLFSFCVFFFTRNILQEHIIESQLEFAAHKMEEVDRLLYNTYQDIRLMAESQTLEIVFEKEQLPGQESLKLINRTVEEGFMFTGPWEALMLVNKGGVIVASQNKNSCGKNIQEYSNSHFAFQNALKGKAYYSDLVVCGVTGKPTVIFAAPIKNDMNHKVNGVVIGHFAWDSVNNLLNSFSTLSHMHLLNKDGVLIGGKVVSGDKILETSFGEHNLIKKSLVEEKGVFLGITKTMIEKPVKALAVYVLEKGFLHYNGNNWGLLIEVPVSYIFAPIKLAAIKTITLAMALMVIIICISYFVAKIIVRPIVDLSKTAKIIGSGDLSARVKVGTKDEIGILGNSLNKMTEDLQETTVSRDYVDNIVKSMSDPLIVVAHNTTIKTVNQAAVKLLGYKKDELVSKPIGDVFMEEGFKGMGFIDLIKNGFISNEEKIFLSKYGQKIPILFSGSVMRDKNGKIEGFICVAKDITERKQLINQISYLAKFSSENPSPMLRIAKDCSILYANEASVPMLKFWGCQRGQLLPDDLRRLIPEILDSGLIQEIEIACECTIYSLNLTPIVQAGYVNIYGRDITERKQMIDQISNLAKFPNEAPNPVLRIAKDSSILYANEASAPLLKFWRCKPGRFLPCDLHRLILDVLESGVIQEIEVVCGDTIYSLNLTPITSAGYVNIYGLNITERKQVEIEARKLFSAVGQSSSLVVTMDAEGNIDYVNPKFTEFTGYAPEEVINKSYNLLKSSVQSDEVYERLWDTITSGIEWHGELHNQKKDGELYWEFTSISAIKDMAGNITHFIKVSEDITRRIVMEDALIKAKNDLVEKVKEGAVINEKLQLEIAKRKKLEQSAKLAALGKLAAGIAHEINNPLSFISANLGNLRKFYNKINDLIKSYDEQNIPYEIKKEIEKKKDEINYQYIGSRVIDMIDTSLKGAERMKKIVEDMKTFTMVDRAEQGAADINKSIDNTLGILIYEFKNRIEVRKEYEAQLPSVKCFIAKLNQVFLNLLMNACYAIEGKGLIVIRTNLENDNIVIEIEDNGKGIPDDVKDKIFNPFFTTKEVGRGTGLGLSISHEIIEQHNGELSVKSKVGEGTVFTIRIPACSEF